MKKLWLALALLAGLMNVSAWAGGTEILGDDDPYPLVCLNFSGEWRSDENEYLQIQQSGCRWLKVKASYDFQNGVTTIVPDDKSRIISGAEWKGTERHRWNNKNNATSIETHRYLHYPDKVVTELVMLEKANENLLLESTFRRIEPVPGQKVSPPREEYRQRFFRRDGGKGSAGQR